MIDPTMTREVRIDAPRAYVKFLGYKNRIISGR